MATYFNKYYFEFRDDIGFGVPVTWRVDIMDSEGAVPADPILLEMGATPLIFERFTDDESKDGRIVGEQATIEYIYTGAPNEPEPEEFFEASERRFRVEIRRNGVLNRVFFIRPDECQYPEIYPPYTVVLKAVDGYSFAKGIPLNVYQESGLLLYDKVRLYDLIMTRGLLQTLEPSTPIRVLQTLYPDNIEPGEKMLFGISAHIDIFYDFVTGAKTVHDAVSSFCQNFYARCFNSQAKTWFVRTQDLDLPTFTVDEYTDSNTVTEVAVPDMVKLVGTSEANDGIVIMPAPLINMQRAVKRAEFEVEYRGINKLLNFDWFLFNGTDFSEWERYLDSGPVSRVGSGTTNDPYLARLLYSANQNHRIGQSGSPLNTPNNPSLEINVGEILEFEMRYRFNNTKSFKILIYAVLQNADIPGDILFWTLDAGGKWTLEAVGADNLIYINRSGRKRDGSLKIKSQPLPFRHEDYLLNSAIIINIFYPNEQSYHTPEQPGDIIDGPMPDSIDIWPIKLATIRNSSIGRNLEVINNAEFSQVLEPKMFDFIDTGEDGLSNTLFTGDPLVPAENWDNDKPDVSPADIERHMAEAYIDQAPRSPKGWEGTIRSNNIDFHNVIEFTYRPGVRFMQITDRYIVHNGTHEMKLQELFNEGNADVDYSEYDIEETQND